MTRRLLLATRNTKKLNELRRILDAALGKSAVELVGLDDVPSYPATRETGLTFAENALAKARDGARYTGLPTVADDSGLAVDALSGHAYNKAASNQIGEAILPHGSFVRDPSPGL